MSFRALVLVGVVALATAFYQSTQPLAALADTMGLTPHPLVEPGRPVPVPLHSMRQAALPAAFPFEPPTPFTGA